MQEAELQWLFGPRSHCADLDNRACDCTAGHCAESETRRRVADSELRIVPCHRPKWRESEQIGPSVPEPRSTLSDRILGGGIGRGHHVRSPGYAGIHI